ncbi:FadR/GntR family transcriptional regulator [Teichococcus aestuarii]|uniref:FadR/GntR family transcriptional regulator n=1 Tax=Teichococcus aestuarii TaxID=568898 RepID=UPI00361B90A7
MRNERDESGAAGQGGAPVLTLLQAYLAKASLPASGRLPPERALAQELGVSRAELRQALAALERDGQLWRHVGKGTFLGSRPLAAIGGVAELAARSSLEEVRQARLVLEPQLAALAARHATPRQHAALRAALRDGCAPGQSWRGFEGQDARLHREIAAAAGNLALLHLFDQLATLRRTLTWDRQRLRPGGPPPDHPSFAEHARIVGAIVEGDAEGASAAMAGHVGHVHRLIEAEPPRTAP